jgi:stearoyl-CoA desaturase (Delta-9 desaturase)
LFIDFNYDDEVLFRSTATAESKGRSQHQKLARALSFHVKADGYRKDNRGKTLADGHIESTKVHLCPLRQRAYLDKEGRYSRTTDVHEPLILANFLPLIFRIPTDRINWTTSSFLIGTFFLTLTAVPLYLWYFGIDWFQLALFAVSLAATGFSVTLGYHRLFSHMTFRAKLPVRLFTLICGAAAFENSVLMWASEHRRHHKHVDHDEDPYDITKGFFHAHIGWLLFKLLPQPPFDNVADLKKDPLVMWQHRHIHLLAVMMGFGLPTLAGFVWDGWVGALGGFLIGGVAKVVVLQHGTFLINSACHTIGRQPYSTRCSARDSFFLALFTFGEGYHNYHHQFQHDYRNGVKPWQWDPTKWLIWILSKLGLAGGLRRVPQEAIESTEAQVRDLRSKVES